MSHFIYVNEHTLRSFRLHYPSTSLCSISTRSTCYPYHDVESILRSWTLEGVIYQFISFSAASLPQDNWVISCSTTRRSLTLCSSAVKRFRLCVSSSVLVVSESFESTIVTIRIQVTHGVLSHPKGITDLDILIMQLCPVMLGLKRVRIFLSFLRSCQQSSKCSR